MLENLLNKSLEEIVKNENSHFEWSTHVFENPDDKIGHFTIRTDNRNDLLTDLRKQQLANKEITEEFALQLMKKKLQKNIEKRTSELKEKFTAIENAPDLNNISIGVIWKKSAYWGNCPRVHVNVSTKEGFETFEGYASGYGYDKESAAVGQALNQCNSVLKELYKYVNDGKKLPYGSGYGVKPYFEGGVGIDCFRSIFETMGFTWEHVDWSKTTDNYIVRRK